MAIHEVFNKMGYDDTDKGRLERGDHCCGNCKKRRDGITADTCEEARDRFNDSIVVEDHAVCKYHEEESWEPKKPLPELEQVLLCDECGRVSNCICQQPEPEEEE